MGKLKGDPSLAVTWISLKGMESFLRKEKQGVLIEFIEIHTANKTNIEPLFFLPLLNKFQPYMLNPLPYLHSAPMTMPLSLRREPIGECKTLPISTNPKKEMVFGDFV